MHRYTTRLRLVVYLNISNSPFGSVRYICISHIKQLDKTILSEGRTVSINSITTKENIYDEANLLIFVILDFLKRHKLPHILIKLKFQIRKTILSLHSNNK